MQHLKLSDYDYTLPQELIAHAPVLERDKSRLLCVNRDSGEMTESVFENILSQLTEKDVLIVNNTKVIKARLLMKRQTGGSIEVFLVAPISTSLWKALIRPQKRVRVGEVLRMNDKFSLKVEAKYDGYCHVHIDADIPVLEVLEKYGEVPLPPYIQPEAKQSSFFTSAYQTVFAAQEGAVAAPTAGLHFTDALLANIAAKGIQIETLTLHVGYGTFHPVTSEDITQHTMHPEWYSISPETAQRLTKAKQQKKRFVAVGTTSVRALESAWHEGKCRSGEAESRLFIYPGYQFLCVDAMITNFHLPKSTLLLLVSAFSGKSVMDSAYNFAIKNKFRFYSFGDAMFIF
jgi:S-adenosylmethionine:tRNA ribosyltransferase-isomerase